ncbi:hypothetical protein [Maridesulfovibrio hydrothermalis]|uniref:Uncharacterized protein n=1 Tax=Maridesulfovibrio hydrothermalis AM13 = DSM 14728 TaxID=1121451 RepID=L0RBH4_9BACT|nr:hypothetical protein [Maridesulfovibrio hydrothermalis]CCO24143.1 conserved protein of unknown function [Maridesulfovibrio hydrothermalis AM13 = DSM 14728]
MSADNGPPWPGFVDALSTVLMMMVFFTLLMVLVTGTLSYIVALKEVTPGAAMSTEQVETLVAASQDLAFLEKPSSMNRLQDALNQSAELGKDDLAVGAAAPAFNIKQYEKEKKILLGRVAEAESSARKVKNELKRIKKNYDPKAAEKLKEALAKIARLEAAGGIEKKVQTKDTFVPDAFVTKLVKGINNKSRVIVLYNQLTSTLEDKTRDDLLTWITQNEAAIRQRGVQLTATLNHAGVSSSMSNSVSFKRLYGLIKVINNEGRIPKNLIKFKALNNGVPGTNQVVISLGKGTKGSK